MAQSTQTQRKKKQGNSQPIDTFMLCEKFANPIILMDYDGMQVLAQVKMVKPHWFNADVVQRDGKPTKEVHFDKQKCLFAVPVEKWDVVKPHIKRRKAVAALQLKAVPGLSRRDIVKSLPLYKDVKVSLRNGLVLEGRIVAADAFNMLMRVGKKIVLVWKHAIHEIHRPTADKRGGETRDREGSPTEGHRDQEVSPTEEHL